MCKNCRTLTKVKLTLVAAVFLVGLVTAQAEAVDLFSDGFESGDFATGGWTTQNSDAAVTTRSVYSGTYGAEAAMTTWIEKALSTAGYETIHVKYYRDINRFDSGEYLYVEWYDGSSWNPLETSNNGDYSDGLQDKVCGTGADDNVSFKIRFRTNANKVNEYAFIDDVVVSGTSTVVDTEPPTPNPATFASPPAAISETEITMTATTGSDASPPVEYFFACTAGGGHDSGWTTDPVYTDTGLQPITQYTYTVQMRDSIPNTGTASAPASATTPDNTPPTPDPMTWATPPYSTGTTSIAMVATTATDESGVEYYFTCTSGGGNDSGWQDSTSYTDTSLSPATQYCYTVQARDKSPAQNATAASTPPACATTDALPDTTPPTPDPMTWATPPYSTGTTSIAMVATTATDASGVEYYFQCTSGGGNDSGWQDSTSYEDTGLSPSTQYCYIVQARDKSPNQNATASSSAECATTDAVPDTTPPTPDPMTWATLPYSTGTSSIAMVASTATDVSGVEYYFQCTSGGGNDSGWQDSTSYEDTGLSPSTQYCYTVQARDKSPNQNATAWSSTECATTDVPPPDTTPPTPDPMTWVTLPYATSSSLISMTATTATDVSGVEYLFECTAGGGNDSGWQDSTTYEDTGLSPSTQYTYRVQARDKSPNQNATAWSTEESATTSGLVAALLRGAFHFRADSDPSARVGPHPDIMVRLGNGEDKLIFRRDQGYLPVWYTALYGEEILTVRVARSNCETTVNPFSRVYLVETNPARAIVHWRYTPNCDSAGMTGWVDEYFTVYPDGVCMRTVKNAAGTTFAQWDTGTPDIYALQLLDTGLDTVPASWLDAPALSVTSGSYTYDGYNSERRCYELQCNITCSPTALGVTLDTTGGKLVHNPVIVLKNWGDADADVIVDSQPFSNCYIGYADEMYGDDLVVWLNIESSASIDVSITPSGGSGQFINRAAPPDFGYDFDLDVPPMPMGSAEPGPFGAYYTNLLYNNKYDEQWRVGDHPDVVVQFDDAAHRLVFWRGTNYTPSWTTDTAETLYSNWYCNQFIERRASEWGGAGCCAEPMQDYNNRYSHVRIISSNPARAIVQWRYASCDYNYDIVRDGAGDIWGDWDEEYFTIYPDGVAVREATAYSSLTGGADMESPHIEYHEIIPLTNPGTIPEDCIHWNALSATNYSSSSYDWVAQDVDGGAMTNLDAIANRPIYVVRMKGSTVPFGIVEGTWVEHDPVEQDNCRPFNQYDDWPAWPEADRGGGAGSWYWEEDPDTHCYRNFWTKYPSHCSVLHMKWDDYEHVTDVRRTKIMLNGMVDAVEAANVNNMIPLARSWQYAPSVNITGAGFTGGSYDKTERAYKFTRTDPQATTLEFTLQGSSSSPIVNPCFVIEDWDNDNASLSIGGQPVTPGSDFRQGIEKDSDEVPSLVVWIRQDTTSPLNIVISEAADVNDFTPPVPDPMDWATVPYATSSTSISMTAATATDPSGVEYYFECTAGGGNSSSWQSSATYVDTGLTPSTQYTYKVQARDKSPNQNATAFSTAESATTLSPDLTPPTPDPMTWATPPYSTGTTSIAMVATTATDTSGVEYYFECTAGGGNDSGWQDSTSYEDTGLTPATQYTYRVQARDKSPNQNATAFSGGASAVTDSPPSLELLVDVGCGTVQSGWIGMGGCGTYTDVGGTGIDVTLATGNPSACACRTPGGTGTLPDVEADLLFADNETTSPGADFIVTLSNLPPGASYQLFSYHNRSDEGDTTIPNVTVTGATDVTKPGSILQSHAIMDNPAEILFTAGAGDVVIRYEAPSGGCGGCQVFFNGFELYSTAPANPAVGFETSSSGGLETVTPALISVVVTNADPAETYTVDYAATGGTATGGGVDYTLAPDTLTFNPGVTQQNVSIAIVDDGGGEPDETIIVTLSNVTGLDAVLGTSQHTYTISDYQPDVAFDSASGSGAENVTPANIAVSLTLSTPDTVTVDYAVTGGTATGGGVDYTLLGSGTLTFNPYVTTQNVSLDIVDDPDIESAETVQLTLSNPTNATLGSITQHTYTINDNDLVEGIMWDGLTWFYSGNPADLFINIDSDLEWSPQGGEQYITRIPDQALGQVGQVVERSYYWLTDGQHDCADCFACPGGCYDNSIECIAGTSDMRVGLFEADGEWVTSDGFSVTGSSIFAGYKGYAWRFGPNMLAGPTRWVDCLDEVHKTGNFQKKPASLDNLMNTNDGLTDYIPGFELTPGEWSVLTVKLERTGSSSVRSSITLNDRTYTWTDTSSTDQPSKIDVLAVHMRNNRPYSRLVLGSTTGPDNDPPSPDPMTWATMPYGSSSTAVTMVATTATDVSGVQYYFECTVGAGSDSGWQDSTIYVDTGLQPETSYTYRVMARDKSANQNPTAWSTEETGTTLASEPSKIAPTAITTTCSSVNYQLEGYYTSNENGLTGDLHTHFIGSNPAVPPPPGDGTMWLSNGISGQWIKYEFNQIYTLTTMWVWNYNQDVDGTGNLRVNRGINQCTIEYSTNGTNWTQLGGTQTFAIADGSPTYAHNTEVNFGSVDARYVRLTCISNHGGTAAGLSEVRFYHAGP
ncbi:MAG TPA: Calx-beta domain-containing protein [Sedimentisphaerales bacterium]|nr:Calx-beta domain-containing protein [Sedimentisphaerales bacterium]